MARWWSAREEQHVNIPSELKSPLYFGFDVDFEHGGSTTPHPLMGRHAGRQRLLPKAATLRCLRQATKTVGPYHRRLQAWRTHRSGYSYIASTPLNQRVFLALVRDTSKFVAIERATVPLSKTQVQVYSPAGEGLLLFSVDSFPSLHEFRLTRHTVGPRQASTVRMDS